MVFRGRSFLFSMLSLLAVLAVVATGCGDDDDNGDGAQSKGEQASNCVEEAQSIVDDARQDVELELGPEFDMAENRGKTIWIINAVRTPILQQISDSAALAAEAAGMETETIYADGTTGSQQAAIRQAVAQNADGIILIVIDPATVQPGMAAANRANIPVIDVSNRDAADPVPDRLAGHAASELGRNGEALAAWILADSGCDANVLLYQDSAFPIHEILTENAQATFERLCPDCTLEVNEIELGTFSNTMTAQVQTDLRRSPDTNYVFPVLDAAVPFVDAALRGQSDDIKIVSHDGVLENLDAMRDGRTAQAADMAFIPADPWGWGLIDQMGRVLTDQEGAEKFIVPTRLIDETNVGSDNDSLWPELRDHEADYQETWGT